MKVQVFFYALYYQKMDFFSSLVTKLQELYNGKTTGRKDRVLGKTKQREKKAEERRMDNGNWMELWGGKNQVARVLDVNERTAKFGLVLTEEDAKQLVEERKNSLVEKQRIEFGEGILPKLIDTFCDSPYIYQDNYVDTIGRLQDIFYEYKNEAMDALTDDELLEKMREAFNGECQGSTDYLEETILEELARNIRVGGERFLRESRRRRTVEDDII